jgi:hypothetical protein
MVPPVGTRRLPMDPDARARRDRGHLSESRAAGQQGQNSDDRKDSTDFHSNAPSPVPFYVCDDCEDMPSSGRSATASIDPSRNVKAFVPSG